VASWPVIPELAEVFELQTLCSVPGTVPSQLPTAISCHKLRNTTLTYCYVNVSVPICC
jgi:hypothetical protein